MATPTPDPDATTPLATDVHFVPRDRAREAQFAPGVIVAGRYRIAGILGKGGMGEVYRADDLKLDQPVALKFLPSRLARDPLLLAGLHDEVRNGRQVSHPNVCRIYDIGEADGAHFVAMELVDGEDLARLLRRIGRLAHDKAVDIARGIAAGLAAAHAKGILHRDLKPANVMIDSHGDARITDFGLALSAADEQAGEIAGTPAYMAPELLQGSPATIQSDLYALGLVMYELFTGRRAHTARTFAERLRDVTSEVTTPSDHVRELDPAVERIILRCLASDPGERPRSAREAIELLPGGDPLAAAMAAGQTPSPRIVAAAGAEGSLAPRTAWMLLGAVVLSIGVTLTVRWPQAVTRAVPFERSPEVLLDRVGTIAGELGVPLPGKPVVAFYERPDYLPWIVHQPGAAATLRRGPGAVLFRAEYGVAPAESELEPLLAMAPGRTSIDVDTSGRLAWLLHAPERDVPPRPLDWNPLLGAAGLSPASLVPTEPQQLPPVPFDRRAAWRGTYPGDRTPIVVEAAARHGHPVFFQISGPWQRRSGAVVAERPRIFLFAAVIGYLMIAILLVLAWRNVRLRRGDRTGALRVGISITILAAVAALLTTNYPSSPLGALDHVVRKIGTALTGGLVAYVMYLSLEPYLRRRWPDRLIGWTRLVSGRWRDTMVGRDVLIGAVAGGIWASFTVLPMLSDVPGMPAQRFIPRPAVLLGVPEVIGLLAEHVVISLRFAFLQMAVLVVGMMLLRRRPAALLLLFAVTVAGVMFGEIPWWGAVPMAFVMTWIAYRYGLLSAITMWIVHGLLYLFPVVTTPWALAYSLAPLLAVAAIAVWSFRRSLGGQRAFGDALLDG